MIYILERTTQGKSIPFCNCTPDVIRLLHYGFVASSAKQPRTAFSIPLLQFHYKLWQSTNVSTSGFTKALSSFLDSQHKKPLLACGSTKSRNFRLPFTYSSDLYCRILILKEQLLQEGLQTTNKQKWASKCPRCFGPRENEVKVDPDEPDFIIAMDGNYQQRHYAHASKDSPSNAQYLPTFLPPSEVNTSKALCESTDANVSGIEDPCALAHKAADDARNTTTWQKCDDSGLFAGSCQHDIPLLYTNVYKSGEKLYYPISILGKIINSFPQSRIGVLYDIGCQLETHIQKRSFFSDRQSDLMFGTSVFHSYVHEWLCQVKYNPQLNKAWGLSDGEGLEQLWVFLSPLVSILRVLSRFCRLMAVHNRTLYYAAGLNKTAGEWLLSKFALADDIIKTARIALDVLNQLSNPHSVTAGTYTDNFFQQKWEDKRAYHLETTQSYQEKQKKEPGQLLCLEEQLETKWSCENLSPAQGIARARIVSCLSDQILEQRTRVGDPTMLENLTVPEHDKMLKIWYLKTDLCHKFLALIEEKNPLVCVCCPGEQTTLAPSGTDGQQKLIEQLEYNKLLKLEAEDAFWNNGLFTNRNEPWAVNPITQKGICHLAAFNRGLEKEHCLGWEVRQAMRCAVEQHNTLSHLILQMTTVTSGSNCEWTELAAHPILQTLVAHPILQSLAAPKKTTVARSLLKSELVKIYQLQIAWQRTCITIRFSAEAKWSASKSSQLCTSGA
ncbi:hypothetical protein PTTG_29162 [Puccinia triticina 1-1 BBBD Race 1]|uniref:CxC1 domain-containing protein n=1 Tax=Puccinia triticina (isolate 1-1 / race 1 (BBBD)) TaxID=630390 RepID=A0A180G6W1_PUCT1|nr:hypothetical protein PTTG_29162 [Puccinia triticina 1-1 BBBD Race 1]